MRWILIYQVILMLIGVGKYFGAECRKNGLIIRTGGDTITLSPSFMISPQEVDGLMSKYEKALKAIEESEGIEGSEKEAANSYNEWLEGTESCLHSRNV
ncbi:hypothetical protein Csa_015333 [Cucumis sativus]|uniref:Uncharacterized protein n=1 Tax=Cucumis sativus TaxID=3659 RepID=A0A0A0KYR6_CUCSA|nr:hypothetical protein Csa_015333 [Cucumis sativus]